MKTTDVPFSSIQWSSVPSVDDPFQYGKPVEVGNIRVRTVEHSAGYLADHGWRWGHGVFVVDGELTTELEEGRTAMLTAGKTYHVAGDAEGRRSSGSKGARRLVVD
jgi:hypothetical protein